MRTLLKQDRYFFFIISAEKSVSQFGGKEQGHDIFSSFIPQGILLVLEICELHALQFMDAKIKLPFIVSFTDLVSATQLLNLVRDTKTKNKAALFIVLYLVDDIR